MGVSSLVLTAVGYGVGRFREVRDPSHGLLPLAVGAAATGGFMVAFAAGRDTLYAGLLQQGAASGVAECAADGLVRDPAFAPLLANPDAQPDDATLQTLRTRALAIAQGCRK